MSAVAAEQPVSSNTNELRHVTSNANLTTPSKEHRLSQRTSQHLHTGRLGSRSPGSIPSSPTSIHSSSSAIFERDIEPITPSPPLHTHPDPHRIPRGKLTEQLDQSVPSVLDSAAEILTSDIDTVDGIDTIAVVAPIPLDSLPPLSLGPRSGFTSPISQMSSRSPSPNGMNRRSIALANLPSPSPSLTLPLPAQAQSPPGGSSPPTRPIVQTSSPVQAPAPPTISTPTSAYFSVHSEGSSPTTATHHEHPLHTLSTPASPSAATPTTTSGGLTSHAPPSPKNPAKRLSFLSYTDLLTSAPSSTLPLSSFTQSSEPPPHLPSVIGIPQAQAQGLASSAASIHGSLSASQWVTERDPATDLVSDQGGEWEREGLGRGLEERLEALMVNDNAGSLRG
ncbi:hypothetical protein PHLGIDRAFT_130988 [Phlebiopsis gigantea 11061_1 CR5-6]|uniref:Uncharacterized protein n=1 Tax=Phlebiopsis gigantea (strain 11061_1 CR5-6) TaxID=745531 RepID=A0A0C3S2R3_PHLG1|nr:hypothetical protein PHLGIDRAFT_130988 [Phlebiopsis gigantea 11061_1 CR5-6]